jgi:phytanoyl-CoA hydroxylase
MTTTLASSPSLLERSEDRTLPAFCSWPAQGLPAGYFEPGQPVEAAAYYREHGFVVLDQAFSRAEVDSINQEAVRICRNPSGDINGIGTSAPDESDNDVLKRVLCIHFPNKVSSLLESVYHHPVIVDLLTKIIGPNVKAMQSLLFIKSSGKPGQAWHQDENFIPTRDRSLVGAWIALDDATVINGCLWVLPDSQRPGILWPERPHGTNKYDCTQEAFQFPYRDGDSVPVEVKAGSIVFFNGYLLHRSLPNRAVAGFRRSLVNHYMSAESLLPWMLPAGFDGSVAKADFREIVMVAGEDPYAYKGTTSTVKASVRPSGEGGCGESPNKKKASAMAPTSGGGMMGADSGMASQMGGMVASTSDSKKGASRVSRS